MAKLVYTRTVLHGETDVERARKRHLEAQIIAGVPEDRRTDLPPCQALAVFFCGEHRLEVAVDWPDAAALEAMDSITIQIGD